MLPLLAGCSVRVTADTRLAEQQAEWKRLDGPRYAILAIEPQFEASLAFQETASLFQRCIERERPTLRRVTPPEETDLVFTLAFSVADFGTATQAYPVTRTYRVYRPGPYGRVYASNAYCTGTQMRTMHMGFGHQLTLSAWVPAPGTPAGRRVIWEGTFSTTRDTPDIRDSMPYLCVAASRYYGQSTGGQDQIKIKKKELPGNEMVHHGDTESTEKKAKRQRTRNAKEKKSH